MSGTILVVPSGAGRTWDLGGPIRCKVSSLSTGGRYTVLELELAPKGGAPLHVHHREDEIFCVIDGECTVGDANGSQVVTAGSVVVFPKDTPHFFRNEGERPNRILITAVPGGLDEYFEAVSAAIAQNQPERVATINQQFAIEFLSSGV
jgi:mannose-6-phosphate isomerase-like protein (cupin superfamily)